MADAFLAFSILAGWAYLLRPRLGKFIGIAHTRNFYRSVYMHSLGWRITRWLRKRTYCEKCGSRKNLHLHHLDYSGYGLHSLIIPDLVSEMKTLCADDHRKEHEK